MITSIEINGRSIGPGHPIYVIAEVSANHNQDFEQAANLVREAYKAGADAVKLQTYTADTLTIPATNENFQIKGGTLWDGRTLYDLYQEASMPWEWQPRLKALADEIGISLFSSPFDATAVDFLEEMNVPAYKIASFEIVDIPLIRRVARTGKPMIISTGMASEEEIEEAIQAAQEEHATQIALLKCTSAYPAEPEEMNIRSIPHMMDHFNVPVGLSDHTMGIAVPVASVVLGACIIEKHFTLSRKVVGPDSAFSLEPHELAELVQALRFAERSLGEVHYGPCDRERKNLVFRRSLFIVKDIKAGDIITNEHVRSIRPAYGLHTRHLSEVLGRHAVVDIPAGTPISWDLIR